jgi:hypothetical protein
LNGLPEQQGPAAAPESPVEQTGMPAAIAGARPAERVALGLLVLILGGVVLSRTLLGLPVLGLGAWLTAGRSLPELRRAVTAAPGSALRLTLSLLFFAAALWQAWHALLPMWPLFGISAVLLPSRREPPAIGGFLQHLPSLREVLVVLLLDVYAQLLALDWSEQTAARQSLIANTMSGRYAEATQATTTPWRR